MKRQTFSISRLNTQRRKRAQKIGLSFVSLAILASIIYYLYINASEYMHLLQISFHRVAAIGVLALAVSVINGLINVYLFQSLKVLLSFREGFYLAASASLANQLPLPGGMISRGIYLKNRHGLPYAMYLSTSTAFFFCSVAANGVIGMAILIFWIIFLDINISNYLLIGFGLMTASILVFWIPLLKVRLSGRVGTWVAQAIQGWMLISRNRVLLFRLVALQTGFMLLFALRQWLAFQMLSQNITVGQAILLSSGSVLTQLISFAPGGLGIREIIVGGIASALGFDLTASIAAIELDRLVATLTVIVLGWFSAIMLGREISQSTPAGNDT